MKKNTILDDDEMPVEFAFTKSIPNPWFVAVHGPKYVRVIDKDLADVFPDNESMNGALRTIAGAARRTATREVTPGSASNRKKARS